MCRGDGLAGVRALLGDGDDRLDAAALRDQNEPPNSTETTFFAVQVEAGDGDDVLLGANASYACLNGGPGDDEITSAVTREVPRRAICGPIGGEGDDRLVGGPAAENLSGGPGRDAIAAGSGDDGAGGGAGRDSIELGPGRDTGAGGAGPDVVRGDSGDDVLADQLGADLLDGGEGHDRFRLFFRSAAGVDRLLGESGRDAVELICPSCRVSLDAEANDGLRDGGATTQDQLPISNG